MINKTFFTSLRQRYESTRAGRRELIKHSSDALSAAKRAIFALHRDDKAEAEQLLKNAETSLTGIASMIAQNSGLSDEGSHRAAQEEYTEAKLYAMFLETGVVGPIDGVDDDEIFLAGLADMTGELQRRQVRMATEGKFEEVKSLKDAIEQIIAELLAIDLEGYLRTKFDQAKNNLRRAEEVLYEVTLRR